MLRKPSLRILAAAIVLVSSTFALGSPANPSENTRVLGMGDSLTSGYAAVPVTNAYIYRLYEDGVYDRVPDTSFANAAVPGATSQQVLDYQVPMAIASGFQPDVIDMTVGGNDLRTIIGGADPNQVLGTVQANLAQILAQLCMGLPETRIYIANLYVIRNYPVPVGPAVDAFNQIVAGVSAFANAGPCGGRVTVADVYTEFAGPQEDLLLINRKGADPLEVHPTNAGYHAMERAFIKAAGGMARD